MAQPAPWQLLPLAAGPACAPVIATAPRAADSLRLYVESVGLYLVVCEIFPAFPLAQPNGLQEAWRAVAEFRYELRLGDDLAATGRFGRPTNDISVAAADDGAPLAAWSEDPKFLRCCCDSRCERMRAV